MRAVFCMTSDFNFDQRMQKISSVFANKYEIYIFNRSAQNSSNKILNIKPIFKNGMLFYLEFNLRLFVFLLTNKFDVVYLADTDTLLAGGVATYFKKSNYFYDSHEWFSEVPELEGKILKKKIWAKIEKVFSRKMNACLTVNHSLSKILSEKNKVNFHVVRNLPKEKENCVLKNDMKIIIYQGALNKGRGLEVAIKSMLSLPDYSLHIYGTGDLDNDLKHLAIMLDLKNVYFFGNVKPDTLWNKTCEAYLGLNLLEGNSKNYYYSLANKFFDYLHAHVPSINMAFPEYVSILNENKIGVTIDKLNEKSLIAAIKSFEDEHTYNTYLMNCHRLKKDFTWDNERQIIEKLLIQN